MSRARQSSRSKSDTRQAKREPPPELSPPRKRPLVLALSIVLLLCWLAFMIAMAWRSLT